MKYTDYREILEIIAKSARKSETVEIYYPKTENSPEGWREVEPYSLTTDTGSEGEHLIYGQDRLSPGHIFNAFSVGSQNEHCGSFIIGKIKQVRPTGRKIIVDTYGGMAHVGGGCFSGKDPTKVDRSGAYMARYVAKNIVASGICDKCEIQIAYVIGGTKPLSINLNTFNSINKKKFPKATEEKLTKIIPKVFDLTPGMIIHQLNLLRPIYRQTACYGHFGRQEPEFTWEKTDKIKELIYYLK